MKLLFHVLINLSPGWWLIGKRAEPRRLGEAKGMVEIMADFDQLPEDFLEHFQ